MADEKKNRIDDKRAPGELQWDGEGAGEVAAQAEQSQSAGSARQGGITSIDHDEFWRHVMAYCRGTGNEGKALVDYVNSWLAAAIASQSQAAQPTEWQSIESAPKDGREVLLYLREPYSRIAKAFWHAPWENWQEGEVPHDRDEYGGIGSACPTHWMPLPSAPGAHIAGTSQAAHQADTTDEATKWAERHYRNADAFTFRDLGIVQAAWAEATRRAGTSQATKAQAEPEGWRASLAELVQAMRQYAMDVDDTPPSRHAAMMERAEALLADPVAKEAEKEQHDDRKKLVRAALDAAEKWASTEHLHARDIGRGGPGMLKQSERAEKIARAAIEALAPTTQQAAKAESEQAEGEQAHVMPPFAAPAVLVHFDDATIERAALKHVATDFHRISHLVPNYRCTEQFARLKAFAGELASGFREGRNAKPESSDLAPTTSTVSAPTEQAYDLGEDRIDNALATFLAEHTTLSQDGIDTHAMTMALSINHAALKPVEASDIAEWYEQGYLAAPSSADGAQAAPEDVRNQWISVDERLPDLHQTVALLDEKRWMNTGSDDHSINWHGSGYLCEFGSKYWSIFGESRSQCLEAVTHWMPLPAAPSDASTDQANADTDTGSAE